MTNEEITEFIGEYRNRQKVSEERIKDLEEQNKQLMSIAVSVEKLATNMENMAKEQKVQGEKLADLEKAPADKWNSMQKTFFTAITSSVATAVVAIIFSVVKDYL